jgi:hypothetical protein
MLRFISNFGLNLRVGFYLALRDIRRANVWTTLLIIAVMVLTFLNLVVVSGILVGLIQASEQAYEERYLGNVIVSKKTEKKTIEHSQDIIQFVQSLPEVSTYSARYTMPGRIEGNYKNRKSENDILNAASGIVVGIDPEREDALGKLAKGVIAGRYLQSDDFDKVLVGVNLLYKYTPVDSADMPTPSTSSSTERPTWGGCRCAWLSTGAAGFRRASSVRSSTPTTSSEARAGCRHRTSTPNACS